MKKLMFLLAMFFCLPAAFAHYIIINHNSYALADDYYAKSFTKSQNDVTFIFTGCGWEGKVFRMDAPKRILGEFKDKKFRELSFNLAEGEKCVWGLAVLNADGSKIEMQISVAIDISKGRFIVLNCEGSGFSMKAYKEKPKEL
ncbi:MAG: hypothetical protein IKO42_06055 [Opitutales bacterium]|nr:hypothetical protein [Opitutales bacterium]